MIMMNRDSGGCCAGLRFYPKPTGLLSTVVTKAVMGLLLFGVLWAVTGPECVPGGTVFGLVVLFLTAVCGGKLVALIQLPRLPALPALLGMLLAGLLLRNVPYVSDAVYIQQKWSSSMRNIALAIILTRAGLGLNPAALRRLKAVCVRMAVGPCMVEACTVAVVSHFLLGFPWIWAFMLGFVLAAVSPAVVVPSMLQLQGEGLGVEKGVPTLLMAAGSFDDVLSITCFTTCLGVAFGMGSTWGNLLKGAVEVVGGMLVGAGLGIFIHFFPSEDQEGLVFRRSYLLLGFGVFAVFGSHAVGLGGAGGLTTLVLSFIAGLSWKSGKVAVAGIVGVAWDIFQPLLFGLIGAEITVTTLEPHTVGLGVATLAVGVVIRVLTTFCMVLFAGFNLKEKIFISLAWMPKATVQAAIGSTALDMSRSVGDAQMEAWALVVLTVAVLSIIITAPTGAIAIGVSGPHLLQRYTPIIDTPTTAGKPDATADPEEVTCESKL
ncbi:sodium/hydrogen exchanger 9B2 isoform X1 [Denticeps clupeoides]|uniref:sodium/hydrogen exchanger 9B2 isoform X1 n=2 Tax=Denticeps clupeoides TaxID=299321 RepID=UPI0010A43D01|nr:sodium/hydrogen exchanger 9B2-like isoform X1 [Denticeps clupeoides]